MISAQTLEDFTQDIFEQINGSGHWRIAHTETQEEWMLAVGKAFVNFMEFQKQQALAFSLAHSDQARAAARGVVRYDLQGKEF